MHVYPVSADVKKEACAELERTVNHKLYVDRKSPVTMLLVDSLDQVEAEHAAIEKLRVYPGPFAGSGLAEAKAICAGEGKAGGMADATVTQSATISNYLTGPFDVDTWTVGLQFKGHDVVALRRALVAAKPFKNEFETSDEYRHRFPPEELSAGLRSDSFLATPILVSDYRPSKGARFWYNAEKQSFNISVEGESFEPERSAAGTPATHAQAGTNARAVRLSAPARLDAARRLGRVGKERFYRLHRGRIGLATEPALAARDRRASGAAATSHGAE